MVELEPNVRPASEQEYDVLIKSSGVIVSHRPKFSGDSKKVVVVVGDTLQVYSTHSFACIRKIQCQGAIANFILISPDKSQGNGNCDTAVICTVHGYVTAVDIDAENLLWSKQLKLNPKGWVPLLTVENFLYTSKMVPAVIVALEENAQLPSLFSVNMENLMLEKILPSILPGTHSVAVGVDGKFVAAIEGGILHVRDISNKTFKCHYYGDRKLTCVVTHPYDWSCATGDDTGRVVLWKNPMHANVPARVIFHWHTLPVQDICFTADGSQIFSGGGECTLVKWDVNDSNNKRTVPRLGLPIRHVSVSPRNVLSAVSQADNSIKIISRENAIQGQVRNLVQAYVPENKIPGRDLESVHPSGIQVDPITKSLIMNGKPGQLQCYSVVQDKFLFDVDITQQNFITAERNKEIPFSTVTHVKFSNKGLWLVTIESRKDNDAFCELRLKFWKFEDSAQRYKLNTSIDWPHEDGAIDMAIQQTDDASKNLMVVTSGGDKKFKTWGIVQDTSIHRKSEWWNCENVGFYRDHKAGPVAFSVDGSVLAVAFDQSATLWNVSLHELVGALSHSRIREPIRLMQFGTKRSSHLLLCATQDVLFAWDIISHSLTWAIPIAVSAFTIDVSTDIVAAFSSQNNVYIFPLSNPEQPTLHKEVSKCTVTSAVFIPSAHPSAPGLRSTLVFLNSSQELCVIVPKISSDDNSVVSVPVKGENMALTPFAQLMASKTVNHAGTRTGIKMSSVVAGQAGSALIREVLNSSPYTMPSMSFFCEELLTTITPKRRRGSGDELSEIETHVLSAFQNFTTTDAEATVQVDSSTKEEGIREVSNSTDLTIDVSEISNSDISWIDSIVN